MEEIMSFLNSNEKSAAVKVVKAICERAIASNVDSLKFAWNKKEEDWFSFDIDPIDPEKCNINFHVDFKTDTLTCQLLDSGPVFQEVILNEPEDIDDAFRFLEVLLSNEVMITTYFLTKRIYSSTTYYTAIGFRGNVEARIFRYFFTIPSILSRLFPSRVQTKKFKPFL